MIKIVTAVKADAKELNRRGLRKADRIECRAMGVPPQKAVKDSYKASRLCWTVFEDHKVIALFGVADHPIVPSHGIPWFLGADAVSDYAREFLTEGRTYLKKMSQPYKRLVNVVHADNHDSIRWLRRLGFIICPAHQRGVQRHYFHVFYKDA